MNKQEFEGSEATRYWMDSLPGEADVHSTKYVWKSKVKAFCEWLGKTPDELIAERKQDLKSEDPRVRHRAEMSVKKFLKYLAEKKELAPNTRRVYFTAIRSFYKRNYQELTFFRGDGPRAEAVTEGTTASTKDEIERMVEVSKPRDRALTLFIKDTGLAEADVAKLKLKNLGVKDVSEIFTLEAPVTITTKRRKTRIPTITFLGREGLDALRVMLRIRQRGSPELKIRRYGRHEVKGGIPPEELMLESPLFRSYGKFLRTLKAERPKVRHLTPHAISVIIRKCAIKAGVYREGYSAHALRRFFQTNLESSGMNQNWIKAMMGHKLPGVEGSYSKPQIEMLRDAYKEAYPYLAISEAVEQRSRVEALERQVERLLLNSKDKDTKIQRLEADLERREQLETRINKIEKKLEKFVEEG